jgi:hypothetical protein
MHFCLHCMHALLRALYMRALYMRALYMRALYMRASLRLFCDIADYEETDPLYPVPSFIVCE